MALPGHRRTRSSKKRRQSHDALKKPVLTVCQNCQAPVRPHHACTACGSYQGRQTLNVARTEARRTKKMQARAELRTAAEAEAPAKKESAAETPEA